ncbi:restriction endonuclease subunit S [Clostridium sp. SHJSY1]|uniref:restriction endonuclease subunit S n=1 Tax=Clostridium sp. SHJSY1 TaxID=2942483 RepID=UPI0028751E0B|nr:restriction endonuclease subunit S [Clostridium sp. SHJSY1]MDS0526190.1 restriction endonuclease subunit S [Clostridium sp. SHJSY1]
MKKIREGYKMTELGVIPEEWNVEYLDKLTKRYTGHTPDKKVPEYWSGDIPWISLKDTKKLDKGYICETEDYTTIKGINNSSAVLLPKGTVVLSRDATVGKVGITNSEMATSQHFVNYVCNENLNNLYLYYDFLNRKKLFERIGVGSTIKTIGIPFFKDLKIVLPSVAEQQKISLILSFVDEQIEITDKLKGKTKKLKKGLMQKLLKDGIGHTEFKETEVGVIPKEWEVKRIEDICEILDSKRVPLNEKQRLDMQGDIPYYGANAIVDYINEYLFDDELILMAEDGGNFSEFKEKPIAFYVTGKCWVNNHAHVLKSINPNSSKWVFYSLVHKDITNIVQGGTRAKLNQKDLRRISIPCPNEISEQSKLADILSSVDEKIEEYEIKKEKLQELKKGLMEKLLTGKIRV